MFSTPSICRQSLSAIAAALVLAAPCASALAADATADFSISNGNPNGVWSYGSLQSLGGAFASFTTATANPAASAVSGTLDVWQATGGDGLPWVGKAGAMGWACCNSVVVAANTLTMHPGSGADQFSVVRFTAVSAGTYQFSGAFWGQDNGQSNPNSTGTTTDVYVQAGMTSLFTNAINGFGNSQSFSGTVALAAGQTLDFAVGRGSNGTYFNDSTGLSATVTAVPEPGAAALLLAGLATVGAIARRRNPQS